MKALYHLWGVEKRLALLRKWLAQVELFCPVSFAEKLGTTSGICLAYRFGPTKPTVNGNKTGTKLPDKGYPGTVGSERLSMTVLRYCTNDKTKKQGECELLKGKTDVS